MEMISKTTKITDENGNGFYRIFWDDKVEKVNPVEYYKIMSCIKELLHIVIYYK